MRPYIIRLFFSLYFIMEVVAVSKISFSLGIRP